MRLRALLASAALLALVSTGANAQSSFGNFGDNLILDPWMDVDQVNEGAAATVTSTSVGTYTFRKTSDVWGNTDATASSSNTMTFQNAVTTPFGAATDLLFTVGTGSATHNDGTIVTIEQRIEPTRLATLQYGTANAQTSYVSFCAKASIAGVYSFYILGGTSAITSAIHTTGSSYFQQFTLPAATMECFKFTVPGDTGGTWLATTNTTDTTHGATFGFLLDGKGITTDKYTDAATCGLGGAWLNGQQNCVGISNSSTTALNQVSMGLTSSATFEVTGVKWSLNDLPLVHNPHLELMQVQRYFAKTMAAGAGGTAGVAPAQNIGSYVGSVCGQMGATTAKTGGVFWKYPVNMRAAPTVTTFAPKSASAKFNDFTHTDDQLTQSVDPATSSSTIGVYIQEITDAANAAGDVICINAQADARL